MLSLVEQQRLSASFYVIHDGCDVMLAVTDCLQAYLIVSFGRPCQKAEIVSAWALRDCAHSLINTSAKHVHRLKRQNSAQENDASVMVGCYFVFGDRASKM